MYRRWGTDERKTTQNVEMSEKGGGVCTKKDRFGNKTGGGGNESPNKGPDGPKKKGCQPLQPTKSHRSAPTRWMNEMAPDLEKKGKKKNKVAAQKWKCPRKGERKTIIHSAAPRGTASGYRTKNKTEKSSPNLGDESDRDPKRKGRQIQKDGSGGGGEQENPPTEMSRKDGGQKHVFHFPALPLPYPLRLLYETQIPIWDRTKRFLKFR